MLLWSTRTGLSDALQFPSPNHLRMLWFIHQNNCNNTEALQSDMHLTVHVDAYSGYKANERPRQFTLDEEIYEVVAVLDQWYEPSATHFKVRSTEGKTCLLRYEEEPDEWTLQSGFDGDELLARPSIELVTVDSVIAKKAEQQIESCEHCRNSQVSIETADQKSDLVYGKIHARWVSNKKT